MSPLTESENWSTEMKEAIDGTNHHLLRRTKEQDLHSSGFQDCHNSLVASSGTACTATETNIAAAY
jgi:hypothetical protein